MNPVQQCRICKTPCGDGALDPTRCASCYNMGIVGFNAGRVLTETRIQEFIADMASALGKQRMLELTEWTYALMKASAASEFTSKVGDAAHDTSQNRAATRDFIDRAERALNVLERVQVPRGTCEETPELHAVYEALDILRGKR